MPAQCTRVAHAAPASTQDCHLQQMCPSRYSCAVDSLPPIPSPTLTTTVLFPILSFLRLLCKYSFRLLRDVLRCECQLFVWPLSFWGTSWLFTVCSRLLTQLVPDLVVHSFNPCTWEAWAGTSLSSRTDNLIYIASSRPSIAIYMCVYVCVSVIICIFEQMIMCAWVSIPLRWISRSIVAGS